MKKTRKITMILLLSVSAVVLVAFLAALYAITAEVNLDKSKLPGNQNGITILDNQGKVIRGDDYANISEISDNIQKAFIAVEDKRFYKHHGIDTQRIVGALLTDLKTGSFTQGGSTITCQLAKNTHLSNEKTLTRKLQEGKLAIQLEREYDKKEILELYLNAIYFGKGIYGIKNACRAYFGKSTAEVSPKEAAVLAAIVANPTRYAPTNRENEQRASMILGLMKEQGYLSQEDYDRELNTQITVNYGDFHNNCYGIYLKMALSEVKSLTLNAYQRDGIKVFTYLDPALQNVAKQALEDHLPKTLPPTAELIVADNVTGGILAYLSNSNINTPIKRQPASLLKPFIYATGIEQGALLPDSPILDQAIDFNGYSPNNYNNAEYGWIDARFALSNSLNRPAVSLLQQIGIDETINKITQSGISLSQSDRHLALALGATAYGSDLSEICAGYATLANYGNAQKLTFVRKIVDRNGKTIYLHNPTCNKVFSRESAYLTTTMLFDCAKSGTGKQLSYLPFPVAAKTGTVAKDQGNSDAWCACYTTQHTLVCRYSALDGNTLPNGFTGGNTPTKTLRQVLRNLYQDAPPKDFSVPFNLKKIKINKTVKTELHTIVPYDASFGESETILATPYFQFERIHAEDLFFKDFTIRYTPSNVIIKINKVDKYEYQALINGIPCVETSDGFIGKIEGFPLAKLELLCKKKDKILCKKTKLIRLPYSFITSTEDNASSINAS